MNLVMDQGKNLMSLIYRFVGMAFSDSEYYYANGFGYLYEKSGAVHKGLWEDGTLVVDKKYIVGLNESSIKLLKSGYHIVEYRNGIK